MIKNKCGYELLDYIPCKEQEIINYNNVTSAGVVFKVKDKYLIGYNDQRAQWELPFGGIENGKINLWDAKENIGYIDEIDLKIIELSQE